METKIVYFDETGDDGLNTKSSDTFILTSVYMPCSSWQDNYNIIRAFRCNLDKTRITIKNYHILENALTYNVQRIENDSQGDWNFLLITDKGRIAPMRKTARAIRAFNPIHSQFGGYINKPIKNMIEDVLEKDSEESYFIQISDFISYFVHLYYLTRYKSKPLPNRVANIIDRDFISRVMVTLSVNGIFNEKASPEKYGLVIYPKR